MTESCIHSFMGPVPGGVDMTWEIDGLKQQQSSVVTGRLSQFPGTSGNLLTHGLLINGQWESMGFL